MGGIGYGQLLFRPATAWPRNGTAKSHLSAAPDPSAYAPPRCSASGVNTRTSSGSTVSAGVSAEAANETDCLTASLSDAAEGLPGSHPTLGIPPKQTQQSSPPALANQPASVVCARSPPTLGRAQGLQSFPGRASWHATILHCVDLRTMANPIPGSPPSPSLERETCGEL
jgi:hypothetical protein